MMHWVAISILVVIALIFLVLYWKGVNERNYIRGFLVQILLDEKTYEFQKEGLKKLIVEMEAKDAMQLSLRVNNSIDRLISQFSSKFILASHSLIWEIKKGTK
jgi:hypothetical protein